MDFVKRVDTLGRVVLPKQIRNKYNICNGCLLTISENDNCIILKRYSVLNDMNCAINQFMDLAEDYDYIITNMECVIASSQNHKNILHFTLSQKFKNQKIANSLFINEQISICDNAVIDADYTSIYPLKKQDEICGYIIFFHNISPTQKQFGEMNFLFKFLNKTINE